MTEAPALQTTHLQIPSDPHHVISEHQQSVTNLFYQLKFVTRHYQVHRYAPNAGADSTFGEIALVSGAKPYGGFIVARSPGAGPCVLLKFESLGQASLWRGPTCAHPTWRNRSRFPQLCRSPSSCAFSICMAAALLGGAHLMFPHTGSKCHTVITASIWHSVGRAGTYVGFCSLHHAKLETFQRRRGVGA
jgi:hypothetical protein